MKPAEPPTLFRLYHKRRGNHVHCRLFAGNRPDGTFAHCGKLTLKASEFDAFSALLPSVEFLPETD